MGPWDLGPGTQDPNEGTQMLGPKYQDPNSQVTQILGSKCLDVNTVMNVHVSTKLTVGTSEHSFKSVDEGR